MRHNLELDMILRGIVMTRGDSGATISEMRSDYFNIVCKPWPLNACNTDETIQYLMQIDGLMMEKLDSGLCIWYIDDIGSNVSERECDSNNNVIDSLVATETVSENTQYASNNSYEIPPPRVRRLATSSFITGNGVGISSSSASTMPIDAIVNVSRKRNLSDHGDENTDKRARLTNDQLPLLEKNLDIHNRHNGGRSMAKKTTSTEIENSISAPSELNGCIVASEYIEPIKEPENRQLQQNFANDCRIQDKTNFTQTESVADSTIPVEEMFPPRFGIIGDDFMRSLISFELYATDCSDQKDKKIGNCISGQTVRDAYHLIWDKQEELTAKYTYLIVNVGAIDILLERDLIDIEAEYARLIKMIYVIGLQPIITTIPKILINSNNPNEKIIHQTLLLFNNFLMNTYGHGYHFVDLYASLPRQNTNGSPNDYYYQPKNMSVGKEKLELWHWAESGRKKILHAIDAYIGRRAITEA